VKAQSGIREHVDEKTIKRIFGACKMLRAIFVVDYLVADGRIDLGEGGIGLGAVKAFLIPIHHRLPVGFGCILERPSRWILGEICLCNQLFKTREKSSKLTASSERAKKSRPVGDK
jgi:hypothetical protein